MINTDRLLNLFIELVQIDSPSLGERYLVDRLKAELKALRGEVREDNAGEKINGNAGNLIADFAGSINYPLIILSAHLDRVEPGRGIRPVIRDNYIVSEGDTILAGDDLIGVAAIIETLKILNERGIEHGPLRVIFSIAEEIGLRGAKGLAPSELEADFGLVLDVDGDVGTVVYQAPAQLKFNAVIKGKAAHAGINPDKGINAIKIASQAISEMKLGRIDEQTTANIGVIRGGLASNIVPDLVELEGEIRSHLEEGLQKQDQHMRNVIQSAVLKYRGRVDISTERLYSGFALPVESDIIGIVSKALERLNIPLKLAISGGGSDANIFNQYGLPSVNLGTGMENVHTTDERVKPDNIFKLVGLIIEIIRISKGYKNV